MMGKQKGKQPKLFYMDINIEERVPQKWALGRANAHNAQAGVFCLS